LTKSMISDTRHFRTTHHVFRLYRNSLQSYAVILLTPTLLRVSRRAVPGTRMAMRVSVVIALDFDGRVNNYPRWSHFHFRSSNGACGEERYGTDK
jgi:hypothetical protein